MQMNSGIILAGQGPDIIGSMARGQQAAQFANDARHQNAFRAMMREQGPGIMQGDQNALSQFAQFDPGAALGIQQTRQSMAQADERMQMARQAAARQASAWAQQQDAATVAAEAANLNRALRGASYFYAQGDQQGYTDFLTQQGVDPAQYPFQQFPAIAAMGEGILEALGGFQPEQSGFRQATPEEAANYGAAGGQFGPDGRFYPINPPSGMTVETTPDGGVRLVQGAGVGSRAEQAAVVAEQNRQQSAQTVLADIDRVLALEDEAIIPVSGAVGRITSMIPGTAAHDVDALLDTIGANIAFDALNQMRAASPTGGALGQVTERELALLQATAGSLRQSQSPDQFRRNLSRLRQQFYDVVHRGLDPAPQEPQRAPSADMSPSVPRGGAAPEAGQIPPPPPGIQPDDWSVIWGAMTTEERSMFQ